MIDQLARRGKGRRDCSNAEGSRASSGNHRPNLCRCDSAV